MSHIINRSSPDYRYLVPVLLGALVLTAGFMIDLSRLAAPFGDPDSVRGVRMIQTIRIFLFSTGFLIFALSLIHQFQASIVRITAGMRRAVSYQLLKAYNPIGLALLAIILLKVLFQLWLSHLGFTATSVDEFARTLEAHAWAQSPHVITFGTWLPIHMYLTGFSILLDNDLYWAPRIMTLFFSITSMLLIFRLTRELFDKKSALIAVLLSAFWCNHVWLSWAPLSEMTFFCAIIGSAYLLTLWRSSLKITHLIGSSLCLLVANGIRYEGWYFSVVLSIYLGSEFIRLYRANLEKESFRLLAFAAIPWIFPIFWLMGNYLHSGDPLYFNTMNRAVYEVVYDGRTWGYLPLLIRTAPLLFPLSFVGLIYLFFHRKTKAMRYAFLYPLGAFIIYFTVLPQGLVYDASTQRGMATFIFLLIPVGAFLIRSIWRMGNRTTSLLAKVLSIYVLCGILGLNVVRATSFPKGVSDKVSSTASFLRELIEIDAIPEDSRILIEGEGFDHIGMMALSNSPQRFIVDRESNYLRQSTQSVFELDPSEFNQYVTEKNISLFVLTSPAFSNRIRDLDYVQNIAIANGYEIYLLKKEELISSNGGGQHSFD